MKILELHPMTIKILTKDFLPCTSKFDNSGDNDDDNDNDEDELTIYKFVNKKDTSVRERWSIKKGFGTPDKQSKF